jgi:hypothetical protein
MILPNSRIWMRVRARSIKEFKVNNKRSFNNLACRFCDDETEESQEHLEECSGCEHERRSLEKNDDENNRMGQGRTIDGCCCWGAQLVVLPL